MERVTQLAAVDTSGNLSDFQARQSVLNQLQEVLQTSDHWDDFRASLEAKGLPEARIHQIVDPPVAMDLHLHSTCSDGQVPAHKLAWLARVMGLRTIALTDHDSASGTREFYGEATLLGLAAIPGVELSTDLVGLEILLYFPDAGRFFDFLTSPRGSRFSQYLEAKQEAMHTLTLKVMESVNRWLKRQGTAADGLITLAELDAWYGGQSPYFPGPLSLMGLKRLSQSQREALGIPDARTFNIKVITPAIKRMADGPAGRADLRVATEEVRKQLAAVRRSRAASVAILSHPKDLMTKAKLSIGQVAKTIEYLTVKAGLDGVEIGSSRDTASDVRIWMEIVADINAKIARKELAAPGPLLVASYASDFHLMAPGRIAGEFTLGFGMLDQRSDFRRGNLRPQTTPEELLEAMRHRASLRTADP
jgi:hypothetical protein